MYGCTSYRVSGDEGVLVREEQQGKEFKEDGQEAETSEQRTLKGCRS